MDRFYAWVGELAAHGTLPGAFQYPFMVRGFLAVLVLAPLLGGLSHLVVARRMEQVSVPPAPGMGIALGGHSRASSRSFPRCR